MFLWVALAAGSDRAEGDWAMLSDMSRARESVSHWRVVGEAVGDETSISNAPDEERGHAKFTPQRNAILL